MTHCTCHAPTLEALRGGGQIPQMAYRLIVSAEQVQPYEILVDEKKKRISAGVSRLTFFFFWHDIDTSVFPPTRCQFKHRGSRFSTSPPEKNKKQARRQPGKISGPRTETASDRRRPRTFRRVDHLTPPPTPRSLAFISSPIIRLFVIGGICRSVHVRLRTLTSQPDPSSQDQSMLWP